MFADNCSRNDRKVSVELCYSIIDISIPSAVLNQKFSKEKRTSYG